MSCAVLTYGNSAVSCADLYIQLRIAYRVAHLLKCTSCRKHGKSADKRNFACRSKSGSDTYHIALCDTTVNMTLRKFFFEHCSLGGCSKVSIQNNKILMFFSKFHQSSAIACSCSDFLYI